VVYNFATPAASTVSLHGMNIAAFEQSWSVIVSIVSNPSDSGSLTMKSSEIVWKGSALGSGVMLLRALRPDVGGWGDFES